MYRERCSAGADNFLDGQSTKEKARSYLRISSRDVPKNLESELEPRLYASLRLPFVDILHTSLDSKDTWIYRHGTDRHNASKTMVPGVGERVISLILYIESLLLGSHCWLFRVLWGNISIRTGFRMSPAGCSSRDRCIFETVEARLSITRYSLGPGGCRDG